MIALRTSDAVTKDKHLDLALETLKKAAAINPAESEIVALEGFVHMIRVTIDPASRGQQYSGLAMQTFGKAIGMNPENPRALALLAQMQYGTAQFFGSPTTEACGTLNKALEKFETYKSTNPLAPVWGKPMAEGMKAQCK
jgi:tetratricopeptide (TPR) repeat protein